MPLSINEVVDVSSTIAAGGVARMDFGIGLLLTTDADALSGAGSGKVKSYSSLVAVGGDFDVSSGAYKAAQSWFGQSSVPRPLKIARWVDADIATSLTGGAPGTVAAIAQANASFNIGGEDVDVALNSASTYAAIATALQTAIRGIAGDTRFSNATATYSNSVFTITLSGAFDIGAFLTDTSTSGRTQIAALLGMDEDNTDRNYILGADQEEATAALDVVAGLDPDFYFILLDNGAPETVTGLAGETTPSVAGWAAAGRYMFFGNVSGSDALVANESTSDAAELAARNTDRNELTWALSEGYKGIEAAALLSGINLRVSGSLTTLKFKTFGIGTADEITPAQASELRRKRINFYANYSGGPFYAEGVTNKPGVFADTRYFLDWLVNEVEVDMLNLLRSQGRIPLTRLGIATLKDTLVRSFERGVRNGGIAPGTVSPAMTAEIRRVTGNDDFDGMLTSGYLVNVEPVSELPQADRDAREAPAVNCYIKGSGAVHFVNIGIVFEN